MSTLTHRVAVVVTVLLATLMPHLLRVDGGLPARGIIRLFDGTDGDSNTYVQMPNNPPAQRCFSFSCSADRASFVQWYETQQEAWVVFYDGLRCTGQFARVGGTKGKKKLIDLGLDDKVASFMLWESGMYPTRGIVDLCDGDIKQSHVHPNSRQVHAADIPLIQDNRSTTGIQFGINGDNNRGTTQVSAGK